MTCSPFTDGQTDTHTDRQNDYCVHPFRVSGFFPSTYHQGSAQYTLHTHTRVIFWILVVHPSSPSIPGVETSGHTTHYTLHTTRVIFWKILAHPCHTSSRPLVSPTDQHHQLPCLLCVFWLLLSRWPAACLTTQTTTRTLSTRVLMANI